MRDGQPSQTARGAAAHRAIHQKLEGGAIFKDPFALRILDQEAAARLDEIAARQIDGHPRPAVASPCRRGQGQRPHPRIRRLHHHRAIRRCRFRREALCRGRPARARRRASRRLQRLAIEAAYRAALDRPPPEAALVPIAHRSARSRHRFWPGLSVPPRYRYRYQPCRRS